VAELRGSTDGAFVRVQDGDRRGYVASSEVARLP
jgi:hypothetical protein